MGKKSGEYVERDEVVAELESEKATFEVNAELAGILEASVAEGDTLKIGDIIAVIKETTGKPATTASEKPAPKVEEKKSGSAEACCNSRRKSNAGGFGNYSR
ncbi:hypothetical protein LWM68_33215 [Niabella sp. W65]|nr:hypothetical protein [Niabella sp. W65]MCH7367194.1 hypothetical protein [Niabella sp. W65]